MLSLRRRVAFAAIAAALGLSACSGSSSDGSASSSPADSKASSQSEAAAPTAGYTPTGPLVADNGFRPETNGFAFENYGAATSDGSPVSNLTAKEMRRLFGDAVCESATAAECNLTPQADQWMQTANKSTEGGHCQGFSVLSGMLWQGQENPSDFGASATPQLSISANAALQSELAYAFTFQSLDAYNAAIVKGTPNDIVDKLIEVLKPGAKESYTLGIYKRDMTGGHAVTPFAVEDAGGGTFKILIYDNNYPGVTRVITVDHNANTWSYDAATNPSQPSELYEGDADTKTLDLEPTTPGIGAQPCPFCQLRQDALTGTKGSTANPAKGAAAQASSSDAAAPAADDLMWISLDGDVANHGHLLITDDAGHRIGYAGGTFVNDMPGAHAVFPKGDKAPPKATTNAFSHAQEPDYFVPDGVGYTITIDGKGLSAADATAVTIIGPGYDLYVDDISLDPNEVDTLKVAADVETFGFSTTGSEKPSFEIAYNDTADYTITLSDVAVTPGHALDAALPIDGGTMTVTAVPGSSINLGVQREDDDEDATFTHDAIVYAEGDILVLHYADWLGTGPMNLDVSHAGATETRALDNQS